MAKRKHATALFEVIHSGEQSRKSLLSTPRWWFKKRDEQAAQAQANPQEARPAVRDVVRDVQRPVARDEHDPTAGRDAVDHQIAPATNAAAQVDYSTPATPSRKSGLDLAVDPDRQQITFQVSYTSAIIVTFAIVVAVGLAYLVGQKMSRGPAAAMAGQSSEELRAGPKNPAVLDVAMRGQNALPTREPETGVTSRGPENNPDNVQPAPGTDVTALPEVAPPQKRVLNLNYVVVQSYPDQKGAEEARDALVKAGVGATIERGLKGWTKDWFIVVGLQGFQRASGPEYEAYIKRIDQVSQQFAQRKRSFKAFQPMAVKWQNAG